MKKLLAMVLALVMTLSLAVSASAVKADEKINEDYAEAVAVLNGMGVFKGYEDGSFKPENNITRAEVATIIYRIYTGDVAKNDKSGLYASYNKFTDMAGAGWAAGYIGYCSNAELVKGYPNGTFQPSGNITGYEVLAMILRAVGYDKNGEFTGADWALNVAKYAEQLHILDNVAKTTNLGAPATRELVAEILFRAINVPMVTYTAAFGYQNVGLNGDKDGKLFQNNVTLGKKNFDLKKDDKTADKFGRPTITWTYNTGDEETVIAVKPLATFTEPAKNCEVYDESGLAKDTKLDVYTNSADKDGTYVIADNKDDSKQAMQGRLTEVYEDRIVNIDTYLAKVDKVVAEKTDSKGHVTKAYVLVDEIYGVEGNKKFETDGFEKGDFVLVTVADGEIQSMVAAETKVGTLTKVSGNAKSITDLKKVKGIDKEDVAANHTAVYLPCDELELGSTYNFYYDTYGNVIGADDLALNYVVLDDLYAKTDNGDDTAYGTVYFFDGEKDADVVIDEIGNDDVNDFSTRSSRNAKYYHKVYSYTKDDGVYTLAASDLKVAPFGRHETGDKYMWVGPNAEQAVALHFNKNSQILLQTKDSPDGTFKAYTGYENLPNFVSYNIWYKTDSNGYVSLLYAQAHEFTTRTVFVYDTTPSFSWINDDGDKIATMKVLELVDDELKDTTVDVNYDDFWLVDNDEIHAPLWGFTVGLYDITEGEDGIWYGIKQYPYANVTGITNDNHRALITDLLGNRHYVELDDALAVKYTGSWFEGEVDKKDWSVEDLTEDSIVFVQYDEDKDDTALVVYDLYIEQSVYVDNDKTDDVEYFGKNFKTVTVELEEYEKIDSAEMEQYDDEAIKLAVTYFDKNGDEVTMNEGAGTKVAYAKVSYNGKVTGDVKIVTMNQDAYDNAMLNEVQLADFNKLGQSFAVENWDNPQTVGAYKNVGVIKIDKGNENNDVHAADLKAALKRAALGTNYQVVLGVMNTETTEVTGVIPNDAFVLVQAWDGETVVAYSIQFAELGN